MEIPFKEKFLDAFNLTIYTAQSIIRTLSSPVKAG